MLPGRMDLQAFVAVAQIISALAVTLTLIAVIVSLRQNTRSQKALAVESLAAAITAINVPAMESPALGAALAKASADWNSASREERMVAHFFLFSFSNYWRTPGINKRQASSIRRSGLVGKRCCKNIIMPRECSARGGRRARTVTRRNFRSSFPKQSRLNSSARWPNCSAKDVTRLPPRLLRKCSRAGGLAGE